MEYIAHTENESGKVHSLKEHLINTADLAETFTENENIRKICKLTGLAHDFGKYQKEFQDYLLYGGRRGSVPHSKFGAIVFRIMDELADIPWSKEISFCIDGHHGGLPDHSKWKLVDTSFNAEKAKIKYQQLLKVFLEDMNLNQEVFRSIITTSDMDILDKELITRFIFSCLTDADWLDTEKHFNLGKYQSRINRHLNYTDLIKILDDFFEQLPCDGEINNLRNKTREYALLKANKIVDFYSLNLPTGMGKTYTSLYWALHHAKANNLKRIIIVLPFVNIIDQTAQILKERFGEDVVLEHHSGISEIDDSEAKYDFKKLACENWDYPIIITTTVQFFESLFSNKPSKCRKIHNIAESVVIFDEVQSLPIEIIIPTLTILKNFQKTLETSFLFCTATLPAFTKREKFDGIDCITSLVEDPEYLFRKTKRVKYNLFNDLKAVDFNYLSNYVNEHETPALVIFNTKKDALQFYIEINNSNMNWEKIYHLSTSMCPVHRKSVISKIRDDLQNKKRIVVSSTQLIEAGVDFDFPLVFRAMAPLESIIQSAGRCNREGKMDSFGQVFIFQLVANRMPDKTYNAISVHAKNMIEDNINRLDDYTFYEDYYRQIISLYIGPDSKKINKQRKQYNFKEVAKLYRIIENSTIPLFISEYNEESKVLFKAIEYKEKLSRNDYRKMQVYTVQVYDNFIQKNREWIIDMPQGFKVWYGAYIDETGISMNSSEDIDMIL